MRGIEGTGGSLFSDVDLEALVPARHPLRAIRDLVNASLAALDGDFRLLDSHEGRPSIPPGQLLRATLLQLLYTIRSERQLMERMEYDLLFRWFVGPGIDDPVVVPTVLSKNRDRLLTSDIAQKFLAALLAQPQVAKLLSAEHFPVDGTMLKAFASIKSFRAEDGSDKPPGRRTQRRARFQAGKALERDLCLDDRPGCAAVSQKRGAGEQARLSRPCLDGEPQRSGRGRPGDDSHRHDPCLFDAFAKGFSDLCQLH